MKTGQMICPVFIISLEIPFEEESFVFILSCEW